MNAKEKVVMIPIISIDDFPNHPFEVRDDEEMEPGYYGVTFNYSTTDTSKIHSLNYGHVFFKQ